MCDAALILDHECAIEYLSEIHPSYVAEGLTLDGVIGTSLLDWVVPDDRVAVEQAIASAAYFHQRTTTYATMAYNSVLLHVVLMVDHLGTYFVVLSSHVPRAVRDLTPRQLEVLSMAGKPTKQIAKQLGIRPSTVDSHRARLRHLLNATCDCDLCAIASRLPDLPK